MKNNCTNALCFAFREDKLLVKMSDRTAEVPALIEIEPLDPTWQRPLGVLAGCPCFCAELPQEFAPSQDMRFEGLRELSAVLQEELFGLAGRAYQLIQWQARHRFCGKCGSPTRDKADEHAKICPACSLVRYASVFPAVIVAITRENRILLAQGRRRPKGRRSVLAGFVEPGETLEQCVRREVREEVALEIDNIRYFGSQPWPYTNSLMVGFTAEYAGGAIAVDQNEILEAAWFSASTLPANLPGKETIARRLIDAFVAKNS